MSHFVDHFGFLCNHATGEIVRKASPQELARSEAAAQDDGGAGVIVTEEDFYLVWWAGVFGARWPEAVVAEFGLTGGQGLGEWVATSADEARRVGCDIGSEDMDAECCARAIEELRAAIAA